METPERQTSVDGALTSERQTRSGLSITITPHTIWYAAGAAVLLAALWLIVTKALGTLLIIFIAITIAEASRPIVLRLERYRVPRPLGVLLVLLVSGAVLGALFWILLSPVVTEVGALTSNTPIYAERLQGWISASSATLHSNHQLAPVIDNIGGQIINSLKSLVPTLLSVPFTLISGTFGVLLSVVVAITVTVFWITSSEKLKAYLLSMLPDRYQPTAEAVFADMGRSLGGYVRGVLIAMLLIGLFTGAGLGILGVPYALLLGVFAGLTECIPFLGPWLSGAVAVVVALVTVDPIKAIEVVALFLLVQQLEGNLVQPLVMSRSVHIDPLLVLISILIGSDLLGLLGAVLAVPFVAVVESVVTYAIVPAIRHAAGRGDPPTPANDGKAPPEVKAPAPA